MMIDLMCLLRVFKFV